MILIVTNDAKPNPSIEKWIQESGFNADNKKIVYADCRSMHLAPGKEDGITEVYLQCSPVVIPPHIRTTNEKYEGLRITKVLFDANRGHISYPKYLTNICD